MVVSEQSERVEIFALLRQKNIYLVLLWRIWSTDSSHCQFSVLLCWRFFSIFFASLLACQSDVETLVHLLSMVIIIFFVASYSSGGGQVCPPAPPPPVGTLLRCRDMEYCIQSNLRIHTLLITYSTGWFNDITHQEHSSRFFICSIFVASTIHVIFDILTVSMCFSTSLSRLRLYMQWNAKWETYVLVVLGVKKTFAIFHRE